MSQKRDSVERDADQLFWWATGEVGEEAGVALAKIPDRWGDTYQTYRTMVDSLGDTAITKEQIVLFVDSVARGVDPEA